MPLLHIHSTKDSIVPYYGSEQGVDSARVVELSEHILLKPIAESIVGISELPESVGGLGIPSVDQSIALWREHNGVWNSGDEPLE